MRNYLTELMGTFFLVLTIGLTVGSGSLFAPLAIGCSLMVMVYMGGHISGAHYNPAVSLAACVRGRLPARELAPYMIFQIAGAFAAALTSYAILNKNLVVAPGPNVVASRALLVEFLFTFALAMVVLNVATSRKTDGNSFYGLAIGFTIVVAAFAGGGISGGAFNPAVGLGANLFDAINGGGAKALSHLWIYLVGPLAGGAAAGFAYRLQHGIADSAAAEPVTEPVPAR